MKNGLYIFNGFLLVLIAILFFLHFSSRNKPVVAHQTTAVTKDRDNCKIAYFEMDSLENSFAMVKDVKAELSKKEDAINNELSKLEKNYRNKIAQYQAQGATMSQVQSENAQRDVLQMQQQIQSKKQALDQEYQEFYMRRMKEVKTKIEEFLKQYNQSKQYSYIVAYEPGLFYYRDTVYNITSDLIRGLNELYEKKK
ncbi:MAG: OmpH family outer membrane protein [Bacteroidota bacterium]|nr:OmpH family outer membrane protein [Flavisolibacter sp.]MBD0374882.1 OmpH family outer membrane protein [Flavisolibacter sp.]MDQ3842899.1 OmpH family outer membrane protein [Bacteroidota bacterium]